MSQSSKTDGDKPDPKTHEGFVARAFEMGGLKEAVREAEKLFAGYGDREIRDAAGSMSPKVRTAIMKMVNLRKPA